MRNNQFRTALVLPFLTVAILLFVGRTTAQESTPNIRVAKLVIDPSKLESYKAALREEIEASIKIEPGVLSLYAVYEKNNPTHVTVFEIYANQEAYNSHIQTPHFKKYKETVADMVKSLELAEMSAISLLSKLKPTVN